MASDIIFLPGFQSYRGIIKNIKKNRKLKTEGNEKILTLSRLLYFTEFLY